MGKHRHPKPARPWRDRVHETLVPAALRAGRSVWEDLRVVEYDFYNGLVRFEIPEGFDEDLEDRIQSAIESAVNVPAHGDHPSVYRYTSHVRRPPTLVRTDAVDQQHLLPLQIELAELEGLHLAYNHLTSLSFSFDYCATFALGGLPALGHILDGHPLPAITGQDPDGEQERIHQQVMKDRAKFHLFEGLNWSKSKHCIETFTVWLSNLPKDSRVLVFDTAISGAGVNLAAKVIRASRRPEHVEVWGVLDQSRERSPEPTETGTGGHVATHFFPVPRIITEDREELIGFDKLQKQGGLKARWSSAVVDVIDGATGESLTVIGTSNLSGTIGGIVRSPLFVNSQMDADFRRDSLYIAGLNIISTEFRDARRVVEKAREAGLLSDEEAGSELDGLTEGFQRKKEDLRGRLPTGNPHES